MSKESGVASSTIGNFLSGKTDYLTVGKLVLIADAFGLPIEKMFLPYGVEQTYEEALDET